MITEYIQFWHWLLAGLIFLVLEILIPKKTLVWPGLAAVVCSLLLIAIQTVPVIFQIGIFISTTYLGYTLFNLHNQHTPSLLQKTIETKCSNCFVGQTHTLKRPIQNGKGSIKIDSATWGVLGDDMPIGKKVIVIEIKGRNLIVKEASKMMTDHFC